MKKSFYAFQVLAVIIGLPFILLTDLKRVPASMPTVVHTPVVAEIAEVSASYVKISAISSIINNNNDQQ